MLTMRMNEDSMEFFRGQERILTVEETETENGVVMALKGALHSETAHHIQDELDAFTTVGVKVTLDFKEVTFVGASFLKALLNSQQTVDYFRQGELVLRNIPASVYQELEDTGITELLLIEE